jgi:uncharacterized repeat protein (TIGR01451 family)
MRRLAPVLVLAALLAAVSLATLIPTAGAAVVVTQVLGRNATRYTSPAGSPTPISSWVASAQGEYVDSNDNGITDSLRGRGAVLEDFGITRARIVYVRVQALIGGVWQTVLANETDVVSDAPRAYAVSYTPTRRLCGTDPALTRSYRVVNYHAVRRVDGAVPARTHYSHVFTARALVSDPACPELPPPPPPAPTADVSVTKTASVTTVPGTADSNFTYTIAVRNLDTTDPAANVAVIDTLPADVNLDGPLPANCTDTDPGAPIALRCTFGTLDPGEVNTVTITVTADVSDFTDGLIRNTARVDSTTDDPNGANNTSTVDILVRPLADVSVTKTATQATVTVPGDQFRYVIAVTNSGPSSATSVTVVDTLPEGLEVIALPAGCMNDTDPTAEPDTITCSFGTLAAGASTSVSIDVVTDDTRADDTLPYVNTARVTTSTYEQNTANNSDTETTPVVSA